MKKNNNKILDERELSLKRKVSSDAFWIVFYGLLVSVLIQQFVLDAPFSQYSVEWVLFAISAFYIVIRNIVVGNNLFDRSRNGQRMVVVNSVVSGLAVAVITVTLNTARYGYEQMGGINSIALIALITFAFGTAAAFIVCEVFYIINQKRQKQLDDKYHEEDE